MDETNGSGKGFLAEVTRQWEGAAQSLTQAGVRTSFSGRALCSVLGVGRWLRC